MAHYRRLMQCQVRPSAVFLYVVTSLTLNAASARVPQLSNTCYLRDHAETRGFMLGRPAKAVPTPDGKTERLYSRIAGFFQTHLGKPTR